MVRFCCLLQKTKKVLLFSPFLASFSIIKEKSRVDVVEAANISSKFQNGRNYMIPLWQRFGSASWWSMKWQAEWHWWKHKHECWSFGTLSFWAQCTDVTKVSFSLMRDEFLLVPLSAIQQHCGKPWKIVKWKIDQGDNERSLYKKISSEVHHKYFAHLKIKYKL